MKLYQQPAPSGRRRLFPGWWVLVVGALASGLGGALASQGASVLFKPVAADLNLTRAKASTAPAITALSSGVTFFLAGWLSDRTSPKWVVISGLAIMIAGCWGMQYVDAPWSYYLVWGVVVGAGQGLGLTVACDKAVTLWFARKQGLAMGLRFAIMGVVSMAALPLIAWLITAYGWRTACAAWAGVMTLVIPLVIGFFKSGRPEEYGFLPDGLP
ncbi:MAG: MFS transporter, partial [Moorellales bacterium]